MAKLVLNLNGEVVKEYELDKEVLSIGRNRDNDIHIDNLATSGNHAKVLTILNDSFIEDLDSTNGTFIGNNKISKYALQNGDSINIGKHELTYLNADTECDESQFEKTMIIRSDSEGLPKTDKPFSKSTVETAGVVASTRGPGHAKLQLMTGSNAGKELQLTQILTTLGKPDIQTAAITRRPTGYFMIVIDAGNDNKMPLVNDTEISKQHELADGDVIEVAGVKMRFNLT